MTLPVEKNIRYKGWPRQQRWAWGLPQVYGGDWLAQRPVAGHPARLVHLRQPWEAGPYMRVPAVAMGNFLEDAQAAVLRPLCPWVVGGAVLLFAGGFVAGSLFGGE